MNKSSAKTTDLQSRNSHGTEGDVRAMAAGELSERKKWILKAVIEAHIETGEPVGSK